MRFIELMEADQSGTGTEEPGECTLTVVPWYMGKGQISASPERAVEENGWLGLSKGKEVEGDWKVVEAREELFNN